MESAVTPATFPLADADHLRANGIELAADQHFFDARRRIKNEHELAGIRRACRAVEAGVAVGVDMLRRASRNGEGLVLDGEPLTSERIKLEVERAFGEHGAAAEEFIVSHGSQTAVGHDGGSGPIAAGEAIVFDLFPRDRDSACYSDFAALHGRYRTGRAAGSSRALEGGARLAVGLVRPGVKGIDIHRQVCDFFHEHGYPTQLHKAEGEVLVDGFFHGPATASVSRCTSSRTSAGSATTGSSPVT